MGLEVGQFLLELLIAVSEVKKKAIRYNEVLESMESTLKSITPHAEKLMININEAAGDIIDDETKKLWDFIKNGKEIVSKSQQTTSCFGVVLFCCFTNYLEQLRKLDQNLTRFCQIMLPIAIRSATQVHEEKQIGDIAGETSSNVEDIREDARNIEANLDKLADHEEYVLPYQPRTHSAKAKAFVKIFKGLTAGFPRSSQFELQDERRRQFELELERKWVTSTGIPSLRPYLPPEPSELIIGLEKPLRELKQKLFKHGRFVVALSAPGGYGKTTLAKKLCQDEDIKAKFKDNIFFISVSKTPNLKVIIQGLFLNKGLRVCEFQSDEDAINHMELLFQKKIQNSILMVLDDVWQGLDYLIGKFINFQVPDYKVVVTSRFTFQGLTHIYKMDRLNESDSLSLFRKSACLEDDESQSIDDDLAKQVVKACEGFPLVLNVVGCSLCRQPSVIWKKTLNDWSKGSSILKHKELLLKTSLDTLEFDNQPRVKECYMDLGSFPEGQPIPATALIDLWVELYGMDEDGPEFIANLVELSSLNLLDLEITRKDITKDDGYYNDQFVMQHDVLKELVNHLSKVDPIEKRKRLVVEIVGQEVPEWLEQDKQPIRARLISISTDKSFLSNWSNMHAPEARVLILIFYSESHNLPQFITSMDKLKVVIITNYSFLLCQINNFELLGKLAKLKRVRLEHVLVPSLASTFRISKNLQKICLYKCDIGDAFGNLTSNALPNLVEINISYPNNLVALPSELCHLLSLKKLYITYCQELSSLPKEIKELANLEELRLSFCTLLSELTDTIGSLQRLRILDLSHCTSLNELPKQIDKLKNLSKLYMTRCSSCKLPESFFSLTGLEDVICDEVMAKLIETRRGSFSNLNIKIIS